LAAEITRAINVRHRTQDAAAARLGIDQSKVSPIERDQFRGVGKTKLLELVAKLAPDVRIGTGPVRIQVPVG
jgi:predicted XRE-type DNA-binding protein